MPLSGYTTALSASIGDPVSKFMNISDIDFHKPVSWHGSSLDGESKKFFDASAKMLYTFADMKTELVTYECVLSIVDMINKFSVSPIEESKKMASLQEFFSLIRIEFLSSDAIRVERAAILTDSIIKNAKVYFIYCFPAAKKFLKTMSKVARRLLAASASASSSSPITEDSYVKRKAAMTIFDCLQAWGEAFDPTEQLRSDFPTYAATLRSLVNKHKIKFLRPAHDPTRVPIFLVERVQLPDFQSLPSSLDTHTEMPGGVPLSSPSQQGRCASPARHNPARPRRRQGTSSPALSSPRSPSVRFSAPPLSPTSPDFIEWSRPLSWDGSHHPTESTGLAAPLAAQSKSRDRGTMGNRGEKEASQSLRSVWDHNRIPNRPLTPAPASTATAPHSNLWGVSSHVLEQLNTSLPPYTPSAQSLQLQQHHRQNEQLQGHQQNEQFQHHLNMKHDQYNQQQNRHYKTHQEHQKQQQRQFPIHQNQQNAQHDLFCINQDTANPSLTPDEQYKALYEEQLSKYNLYLNSLTGNQTASTVQASTRGQAGVGMALKGFTDSAGPYCGYVPGAPSYSEAVPPTASCGVAGNEIPPQLVPVQPSQPSSLHFFQKALVEKGNRGIGMVQPARDKSANAQQCHANHTEGSCKPNDLDAALHTLVDEARRSAAKSIHPSVMTRNAPWYSTNGMAVHRSDKLCDSGDAKHCVDSLSENTGFMKILEDPGSRSRSSNESDISTSSWIIGGPRRSGSTTPSPSSSSPIPNSPAAHTSPATPMGSSHMQVKEQEQRFRQNQRYQQQQMHQQNRDAAFQCQQVERARQINHQRTYLFDCESLKQSQDEDEADQKAAHLSDELQLKSMHDLADMDQESTHLRECQALKLLQDRTEYHQHNEHVLEKAKQQSTQDLSVAMQQTEHVKERERLHECSENTWHNGQVQQKEMHEARRDQEDREYGEYQQGQKKLHQEEQLETHDRQTRIELSDQLKQDLLHRERESQQKLLLGHSECNDHNAPTSTSTSTPTSTPTSACTSTATATPNTPHTPTDSAAATNISHVPNSSPAHKPNTRLGYIPITDTSDRAVSISFVGGQRIVTRSPASASR